MLLRHVHTYNGDVFGATGAPNGAALRMVRNQFSLFCGLALAVILFALPAHAQGRQTFSVASVAVDARAADEFAAKSNGIAQAQQEALRILFKRMTLAEDHDRLPELESQKVTGLLRDYSVDREKFGGGRYVASLTVRFKADGVRKALRDADIPFAETASRPVLVLPVFQTAGSTILWDDANPWFAAWSRIGRVDGLLPLLFPVRDLSDVSVISAEEAVLGERGKLSEIADRYAAGEAMVVVAALSVDQADGILRLEVATTRYGGNSDDRTVFRRFQAEAGQTRDALLINAAKTLTHETVEGWKRDNLLERSVEQRIAISVPLRGLRDWLNVRAEFDTLAALRAIELRRLSIDRAEIEIVYLGNVDQLRLALAQRKLDLSYAAETASWTLRSEKGR